MESILSLSQSLILYPMGLPRAWPLGSPVLVPISSGTEQLSKITWVSKLANKGSIYKHQRTQIMDDPGIRRRSFCKRYWSNYIVVLHPMFLPPNGVTVPAAYAVRASPDYVWGAGGRAIKLPTVMVRFVEVSLPYSHFKTVGLSGQLDLTMLLEGLGLLPYKDTFISNSTSTQKSGG